MEIRRTVSGLVSSLVRHVKNKLPALKRFTPPPYLPPFLIISTPSQHRLPQPPHWGHSWAKFIRCSSSSSLKIHWALEATFPKVTQARESCFPPCPLTYVASFNCHKKCVQFTISILLTRKLTGRWGDAPKSPGLAEFGFPVLTFSFQTFVLPSIRESRTAKPFGHKS